MKAIVTKQGFVVLSEINIYPIKSTKGIALQSARVEQRGLEHDRRWMVVDESGKFISQRTAPRLALISTSLHNTSLLVSGPGMRSLAIPFTHTEHGEVPVRIWDDTVQAVPAGDEVQKWFCEFLQVQCRVVFMPDTSLRQVNPRYGTTSDIVSFADGYPLMLMSKASVDDLNMRLSTPVPMNRFRPSIVVDGCEAFEEDRWRKIRIGEVILNVVKPCARCVTTTVDQATGIAGKEPLATLSTYRTFDNEVYFGQNVIPETNGTLHKGDRVEIISHK
ncbi:MAG TPA: MOSC N-terminal beta barrel domain-containing protein [Bacteroidota bacterium]|nr:MOSC N-terminal beta barrel domain-containing protein [Bacteroidota bacterium]